MSRPFYAMLLLLVGLAALVRVGRACPPDGPPNSCCDESTCLVPRPRDPTTGRPSAPEWCRIGRITCGSCRPWGPGNVKWKDLLVRYLTQLQNAANPTPNPAAVRERKQVLDFLFGPDATPARVFFRGDFPLDYDQSNGYFFFKLWKSLIIAGDWAVNTAQCEAQCDRDAVPFMGLWQGMYMVPETMVLETYCGSVRSVSAMTVTAQLEAFDGGAMAASSS